MKMQVLYQGQCWDVRVATETPEEGDFERVVENFCDNMTHFGAMQLILMDGSIMLLGPEAVKRAAFIFSR